MEKSKKIILAVIICIALAVIGTVVFINVNNNKETENTTNTQKVEEPEKEERKEPGQDENVDKGNKDVPGESSINN